MMVSERFIALCLHVYGGSCREAERRPVGRLAYVTQLEGVTKTKACDFRDFRESA